MGTEKTGKKASKELNLIEGPILSSFVRFALPILGALFLQLLYGSVDLLVVGQFAETADVSAVATGSMFTYMPTSIVMALSMGITIVVGEFIGQRSGRDASRTVGTGICLFAVVGVILTVVVAVWAEPIALAMQAPAEAFTQTVDYIRICGLGMLFIVAYNVLAAVFRGIGDSKTPLMTVSIACAFNIGLDLLLIMGFGMGAAGAAVATVVSQGISVVLSLLIIRRRALPFRLARPDIRFDGPLTAKILRLGIPIALQELLVSLSFVVIQSVVNTLGVDQSAAIGIGEKVAGFLLLIGSAAMQSISAFVAQNMGAGKPDRAKKVLRQGCTVAVSTGVLGFVAAFFFGDVLASIFDSDPEVVAQARLYLMAYAFDCILYPFLFSFLGYFNGCERTMFVMVQGIVGAFCVRIPLVFLFCTMPTDTLFYIGLATPSASAVQIVLSLAYFAFLMRREREREALDEAGVSA